MTQQHQSCERSRQAVHLRFTANLRSCRIIAVFSRKEVLFSLFLTVIPMSNHLNVIVIYVLYFSKLYQMCRFNFPVQLQCFGRKNKCHQQKKKKKKKEGKLFRNRRIELLQKVVRVTHAVCTSVTASNNTAGFLEKCNEVQGES